MVWRVVQVVRSRNVLATPRDIVRHHHEVEISVLGTSDMGARGAVTRKPAPVRNRLPQTGMESPINVENPAGALVGPEAVPVAGPKPTQEEFGFGEVESRGQFERTDRNLFDGQDLDVPTYLRKGIKIAI